MRQRIRHNEELVREMNETTVPYGMLALWFIGQEGVVVKGGSTIIYIDPFVSSEAASRRAYPPPLAPEHITNADFYLITHEHLDHLDPGTVPVVARQSPHTEFVAPACCRSQLVQLGVPEQRILDAITAERRSFGDWDLLPIPAAHETLERDEEGNDRFVGYVIRLNGVTLYHAGDTVIYPGLLEKLQAEEIDIGMLPINGGDFFRRSRGIVGNMSYIEAAKLADAAGFDLTIPLHYDVFASNGEHPGNFIDYCYDNFPYMKCHVMARTERLIYVKEIR
ncbi:MBL fold metallo-hydrolase [Paenibacillus thalictri]|uniref:MBL fold metallo-hydrolase n=1 Tax=Paenibacillus thalictri TaxID=2527873 RepID=A0A4V2J3M9_9BACL|nr:MBL fold metallo-hydrolase [Paenibacillus thalictri]TBL73944.1 MBL fold metallo-hydrolase [Paenibacillus thalictri]